VDPPFVLPIKMVISGLEIGMSEHSEFFRFPWDNHFYRGAAGQHMGALFFGSFLLGKQKK